MSARAVRWSIRLTQTAERDFREIHEWTASRFGTAQAEIYENAMVLTIEALQGGPMVLGIKIRDEIAAGLRSVPVKLKRRKGRHFVFFRVSETAREILVLRILHVAMDPARHVAVQPKT